MRAIVQRVSSASVTVNSEVISSIKEGLMVLVGLGTDDTSEDIEAIAQKILKLKTFPDEKGSHWRASVVDRGGEILCVSQFTLFAKIIKNKPDFHKAMPAETSRAMYGTFLKRIGALYDPSKIKDGQFGAMMSVGLTNEGPVTFTLASRLSESTPPSGVSTPNRTLSKADEKKARRAAWEAAKKEKTAEGDQIEGETSSRPVQPES